MLKDVVKKIVLKLFPELSAGLHLPRLARVLAVNDAPGEGGTSERFRPRYAVDLEILTPEGERDGAFPIYEAVPLPVPVGCGQEAGLFGFPEPGTIVEIGFAYGRPDHPLVRQIYPQGLSLPGVLMGQQRWQQSPAVFQTVDKDGNWSRETDGAITDKAFTREAEAVENLDTFSRELRTIHENSTEEVGGFKIIEALGALRLRSGGSANLVAADNINLITARDFTLTAAQDRHEVAGRDHFAQVKGNLEETTIGNRTENVGEDRTESTGGDHTADVGGESTENVNGNKRITAPFINLEGMTVRIGRPGAGVSLLPTIIDFMEEVRCALHAIAIHTHNSSVAPDNDATIETHSGNVGTLKGKLDSING
ncbi:bacteriophage T4 gp5 trimerisation domain-containing protein [Pseudodesulfovibrio sp.]|uniref:bacteriophage T4 gp5 trimerisation domain-containing protein n=1 Tax=unclassified Pseudodesulfovibrio TaxID=2661612 RepID=UPI003AFFF22B